MQRTVKIHACSDGQMAAIRVTNSRGVKRVANNRRIDRVADNWPINEECHEKFCSFYFREPMEKAKEQKCMHGKLVSKKEFRKTDNRGTKRVADNWGRIERRIIDERMRKNRKILAKQKGEFTAVVFPRNLVYVRKRGITSSRNIQIKLSAILFYLFSDTRKKSPFPIFFQKKPEVKVYTSVKNFNQNVKTWTFFQFLGISLFSNSLVSPGSENAILLRKYIYWNMSYCDPQIAGIPRSATNIEFSLYCNSIFFKNTRLIFFIEASFKIVLPVKKYHFEKSVVLCPASRCPLSKKFRKRHQFWFTSL